MSDLRKLYDRNFQGCFLAHMLRDSKFLELVYRDVDPTFFSDEYWQWVVLFVQHHYQDHKTAPSELIYHQIDNAETRGELHPDVSKNLRSTVDELFGYSLQNKRYLVSEFSRFLRHRMISRVLPVFAETVETGDFERAESMMKQVFVYKPFMLEDLGRPYTDAVDERTERRKREEQERFWTLIPPLDLVSRGLKRGQIGVWQSQKSSFGKSSALAFLARGFLLQGKKVLIFTMEETREEYEDRLDQALTGLPIEELVFSAHTIRQRFQDLITAGEGGQIYIKELPAAGTKMSYLRELARQIESVHGFTPDVVIIDYCDVMEPETKRGREESNTGSREIYQAFHDWMREDRMVGWTGMQSNREAAAAASADQEHAGQGISKMQIAELVISINRTAQEEREGKTRLWLVKNRWGPRGIVVTIRTDFSRGQFWVPDEQI